MGIEECGTRKKGLHPQLLSGMFACILFVQLIAGQSVMYKKYQPTSKTLMCITNVI